MNPAFIILVLLGAILLWFLLSFIFYPLGKMLYKIWNHTMNEINKKEENKENKENKGENE